MKTNELDFEINKLVRRYGILNVIKSLIASCDTFADFFHSANNKKLEDYWRRSAVSIFDATKNIDDPPTKSQKF